MALREVSALVAIPRSPIAFRGIEQAISARVVFYCDL
jgi:hypothetical protein